MSALRAARFAASYRDIGGADGVTRRRTVIYARGPKGDAIAAGTATFRVDLDGIEDVGNGSGEVIADLYQQAAHFLNFLVIGDYQAGDWGAPPMFPDTTICMVNCPSFTALTRQRRAELPPSGYLGAWIAGAGGERSPASTWLARLCQSGEFRIGPNRFWQIKAAAINEAADVSTTATIRDVTDVDGATGDPAPRYSDLKNRIPYQFGPPLDGGPDWMASATVQDDASIAAYRRTYQADTLELYCLRSAAVAAHVAARALRRSSTVPVYVTIERDLHGFVHDLGDVVRYTHFRGFGASGYVDRPLWVVGFTFIPATRRVRVDCLDLGPILAA